MRAFVYVLLAYVLIGIESPLLQKADIAYYAPDLGVCIAVYVGLHLPTISGMIAVFMSGVLVDGFAMGSPLGTHVEVLLIVFLAARAFSGKVALRTPVPIMVSCALASLVGSLLFFGLSAIFDRVFDSYSMLFRVMGPNALITAPFGPLVFYVFRRVDDVFSRRRRETLFFR